MSAQTNETGRPQAAPRQSRPGRAISLRLLRMSRAAQARLSSTLTRRIVVLNLGGLVALLAGFLYVNQFRENLIDARIQSLQTQGEIIAASIADSATVDTEDIVVDPEKLLKQSSGENAGNEELRAPSLGFSLVPKIGPSLRRLVSPTHTRARIYDRDGDLLLDSRTVSERFLPRTLRPQEDPSTNAEDDSSSSLIGRVLTTMRRWLRRPGLPLYEDIGAANGKAYPEVALALEGSENYLVRANAKGETIISVGVPVQRFHSVRGALLLSTIGGDIDIAIAADRWAIIRIFLVSASVMLLLSLLFAGAIAEPMRRLAEAAERVRRGVKSRPEIPDFTDRQDEIGHLSGALRDMTTALYNRIEAIEHFAADVAHELKNPLTSLRSAVETLPIAKSDASRTRLLDVIKHDVDRLDRLISDISDASRLDAELARADMTIVDLSAVLSTVIDMMRVTGHGGDVRVAFNRQDPNFEGAKRGWRVLGHASRLAQVCDNLIANARSFSQPGGEVRVTLRSTRSEGSPERWSYGYEIIVDDDGPGIPQGAFERVFERFYTDRPHQGFGQNSGLGLSISRQIVEAHAGRIRALNRTTRAPEGAADEENGEAAPDNHVLGARFITWLPAQR